MNDTVAVAILAAGQGTRFKSKQAKVLHAAGGRPLVSHVIRAAEEISPTNIFVIVGYQADAVTEALNRQHQTLPSASKLRFIYQREALGTGHALRCGADLLPSAAPHL